MTEQWLLGMWQYKTFSYWSSILMSLMIFLITNIEKYYRHFPTLQTPWKNDRWNWLCASVHHPTVLRLISFNPWPTPTPLPHWDTYCNKMEITIGYWYQSSFTCRINAHVLKMATISWYQFQSGYILHP